MNTYGILSNIALTSFFTLPVYSFASAGANHEIFSYRIPFQYMIFHPHSSITIITQSREFVPITRVLSRDVLKWSWNNPHVLQTKISNHVAVTYVDPFYVLICIREVRQLTYVSFSCFELLWKSRIWLILSSIIQKRMTKLLLRKSQKSPLNLTPQEIRLWRSIWWNWYPAQISMFHRRITKIFVS